jgi:hypothetical protein
MKNFIKENWFKIGILLIILFAIASYNRYLIQSNNLEQRKQAQDSNLEQKKLEQDTALQIQQAQLIEDSNSLKEAEIIRKEKAAKNRAGCIEIQETFNTKSKNLVSEYYHRCMDIASTATFSANRIESEQECKETYNVRVEQTAAEHKSNIDYCIASFPIY